MRMPVVTTARGRLLLALGIAAITVALVEAQPKRPQATVDPLVVTKRIVPGGDAQLELKVTLPSRIHVQSDKPNDPFLIPTVLTLEPPKGVTVAEIVYPPSESLKQTGAAEPLVVFGSEFVIRARVKVAGDVAPGVVTLPGRLRYQACDDTQCFPPLRAEATWTLRVAAR